MHYVNEPLLQSGLVVDSNFASRKELLVDVQASGLVGNVIEAKSIGDGLHSLKLGDVDACFIGPSLSKIKKLEFLKRGTALVRYTPCTFIAVLKDTTILPSDLIEAGAHGILKKPYTTDRFSAIVRQAVSQSQAIEGTGTSMPKLSHVLEQAASGLRDVMQNIESGRLVIHSDGTPSLATRDAIRLVFEETLAHDSGVRKFGSTDHFFVTGIIDWFTEQVHMSARDATDSLRKRLLFFAHK